MAGVIVVGSGASAVHAAWPLVKAGIDVLMLDVGVTDQRYEELIPALSFEEIRESDREQHRYFLGDSFEGIPMGGVRVGAQLTPPRQYLGNGMPCVLGGFQGMVSGALGGLAAGWGAATPHYTDDDMAGWPIRRRDLQPHYDAVAERVGICGRADDDLAAFFGESGNLMPPARMDSNGAWIMEAYRRRREAMRRRGLHVGHARLAMATKEFRGRGPARYLDMDFWADKDRSVYRPRYTVEELKSHANFAYQPGVRVIRFERQADGCLRVHGRNLESRTNFHADCSRLVLAAGDIATARIVLHSMGMYDHPLPILSNPYTYFPCLVYTRLGRPTRDRRHSLTQLMAYYAPPEGGPLVQAQVYSYRSLMLFKLVKESPLARRDSLRLMNLLQSYFVIVGVHHEDRPGGQKRILIKQEMKDQHDFASVVYRRSEPEEEDRRIAERGLMRAFRRLGCLALRRIDPGDGASIHYGGSLPMSIDEKPMTTRLDGSLRGAENVYIADGSVFPHLPAKGLTFTMMANADRIGAGLAKEMQGG